jgi:hypothetical protein
MFIELTSELALREWLPRLVGIERCIVLRLPGGLVNRAIVEEHHQAQLTRDDTTSTVHYVRFELSPEEIKAFRHGPVDLAVDHPSLNVVERIRTETLQELVDDLAATGKKFLTHP